MHVSLQRLKTHFYLLFSWKTNPDLERRASKKPVNVWLCRVICRWEGVASFVTSQGRLDASDVACNTLCARRVKLCSQSEEKPKLFPSRDARLLICCEAYVLRRCQREDCCAKKDPLPPHICYTRRCRLSRLLVECAENKFGTVHFFFFFKSWKVFCEYCKEKMSWYTSGFLLMHPSVEQYGLVTLPCIILNNKVFVLRKTSGTNTFRPTWQDL